MLVTCFSMDRLLVSVTSTPPLSPPSSPTRKKIKYIYISSFFPPFFRVGEEGGERGGVLVTLTNNLSMEKHVINICRSGYIEIRRISNIRHYLTVDATKTLLWAFVLSKLDYCNSLLSGSPKRLLDKLQKVQNSADRLVFEARKHEHIKPLLQKLHWLSIV